MGSWRHETFSNNVQSTLNVIRAAADRRYVRWYFLPVPLPRVGPAISVRLCHATFLGTSSTR